VRKITVRLASNCGSAYVHSPIYIQLSTGNFWIPPRQPLRFPTTGNVTGEGHPIKDIAEKLHQAVSQAQVVGGNEIRDVSLISTHPHVDEKGNTLSAATVYEFSFTTLDSEVDFSQSGINMEGATENKGKDQLLFSVKVGPGADEFDVKPISQLACFYAGKYGGWRKKKRKKNRGPVQMPEDVLRKGSRKHAGPEGGVWPDDDTLFQWDPAYANRAVCGQSADPFWDPHESARDWCNFMEGEMSLGSDLVLSVATPYDAGTLPCRAPVDEAPEVEVGDARSQDESRAARGPQEGPEERVS